MRSKYIYLATMLLFINLMNSQTLDDILRVSSYYGRTFDAFEKGMALKSYDKRNKFGLESRIYNFKTSKVLIESKNDEGNISKFSFLTSKSEKNEDIWYQATKKANTLSDFIIIESFISSKDPDIYKRNISYSELISELRTVKSEGDLICFIVFKKGNLFYQFNLVDSSFYLIISEEYEKTN